MLTPVKEVKSFPLRVVMNRTAGLEAVHQRGLDPVAVDLEDAQRWCQNVQEGPTLDPPYGMGEEHYTILICLGLKEPPDKAWPHFDRRAFDEANLAGACDAGAGGLNCFIWLRRRGRVKFPSPASFDKSHASLNTYTHANSNSHSHPNPLPDTPSHPVSGMPSL